MPERNRPIVDATLAGAERYTDAPAGIVFPTKPAFPWFILLLTVGIALVGTMFLGMTGGVRFALRADVLVGLYVVIYASYNAVVSLLACFAPPGGIAILRDGIYVRVLLGTGWVRWEDLTKVTVGPFFRVITLQANRRDALVLRGPFPRTWQVPRFGPRAPYPVIAFQAQPDVIVRAIHDYWRNPSARAQLTDPLTVKRFGERRSID